MYDYKDDNKFAIGIIVIGFIILTAWLCHDYARNQPTYNNTDNTMADINSRIEGIEQRIDRIQERNSAIEKAVSGTVITIRDSRENAATVADGISEAERRLDAIIQRQGRITNILADIEAANRPGKKNP